MPAIYPDTYDGSFEVDRDVVDFAGPLVKRIGGGSFEFTHRWQDSTLAAAAAVQT